MRQDDEEDERAYKVVVNAEEQYSIWFADRENAPGWRDAGKSGSKAECLAHIEEVWTDMRPLGLRKRMEEIARNPPPPEPVAAPPERHPLGKDELVGRLEQPQAVRAVGRRDGPPLQQLAEQIERGYVFMTFVGTGTELGIRLDRESCHLPSGAFESGAGVIQLVGRVKLNYNLALYRGDLDLATLEGKGRLEFVEALDSGGDTRQPGPPGT